ncbi:MAG: S8 family peptidase [Bacteroidales bacterium]|nr:S8 family peptidase [Bacteroidales bacterium]MBN2755558.1 S8 family peptidase [Bacteroidales bacterium]
MKKILLTILAMGMILYSCQKEEQLSKQDVQSFDEIIPNQYIVVLNVSPNKAFSTLDFTSKLKAVKEEAKEMAIQNSISVESVQLTYGTAIRGFSAKLSDDELNRLKNDSRVKYIVADKMFSLGDMHINKKPTPPPPAGEEVPYGITRVGTANGVGRTAWIIDTGIDYDHPDLTVDVSRAANYTRARSADDDNGHGTHCAGIVAAKDNDLGVIGVAAGATVVPIKVLDRSGSGAYSQIISGIDYVVAHASAGDAANMSLGGGVYQPIDDAVYYASQTGIYFALAAGNESDDALNHSPARVNGPNIWTISAMDINDNWAYFSNYGTPVDYCMPGYNIYSTYKGGGYTTMSGTSMAAPHMCGVLLMTNGNPRTDGYVNGDPDGDPDPIGHL